MAAKILKLWHQWGWLAHLSVWLIGGTAVVVTYQNAIANNTEDITVIVEQKLPERMVRQEQITSDIREDLGDIKRIQGKMFDRINQIADRPR